MILQDVVYLPVPGHGLVAIDSVGGTELWKASGRDARPIARSQQTLLMHDGTQLIVVNSESGKTIRHVPTRPLHTVLRTATGSLILVSPNAWLMRLDRL